MYEQPKIKRIPLSGKAGAGKFALVDEADFERLAAHHWHVDAAGYPKRSVRQPDGYWAKRRMHRDVIDAPSGMITDHIDGDKLNNQQSNLRVCTVAENNRNIGLSCNNTSGYKGVSWSKPAKKWMAMICVNSGRRYLGLFEDAKAAAVAYDNAALEHYGSFAWCNTVRSPR